MLCVEINSKILCNVWTQCTACKMWTGCLLTSNQAAARSSRAPLTVCFASTAWRSLMTGDRRRETDDDRSISLGDSFREKTNRNEYICWMRAGDLASSIVCGGLPGPVLAAHRCVRHFAEAKCVRFSLRTETNIFVGCAPVTCPSSLVCRGLPGPVLAAHRCVRHSDEAACPTSLRCGDNMAVRSAREKV